MQMSYRTRRRRVLSPRDERTLFAKSANLFQNNSKVPCEDAGGNRYTSIYIHSKTGPISTQPETIIAIKKKPDYGLQLHMGTKIVILGEMSSGLMKQK